MLFRSIVLSSFVLSIGCAAGAAAQEPDARRATVDWVVSVILPEAKPVDPERLAAAVRKRVAEKERFVGFEGEKGIALLRVAGGTAMVALMEAPIPNQELQRACQLAWYWRQACETTRGHKAHLLVILAGTKLDKVDAAVLQTRIVAAVLEESNAEAVYWGVNLTSRAMFLEQSVSVARDRLPTGLWISYRLSREASARFSVSTHGLKDFSLKEIEAKDVSMPAIELHGLVAGMAAYLIAKGPVVRDGDTIGHSAKQRIRVRHGESHWRAGEQVYRLDFGG